MNAFLGELRAFLDEHRDEPEVGALRKSIAAELAHGDPRRLLDHYDRLLDTAEALLWAQGVAPAALARFHALHRERERLAAMAGIARRSFLVVIPVADRPRQLESCLESLWAHCRAFEYGGEVDGRYPALAVLVADDSADPEARRRHAALARDFTERGLGCRHFDLDAQAELMARLAPDLRRRLQPLLGPADEPPAGHKGASRMRNLALLALAQEARTDPERLFLFIDSDQTFEVLDCRDGQRRTLMALNHFHHLERLFQRHPLRLVTGKVVGDPPVAPAVMAGTLLDDLLAFLDRLGRAGPDSPCCFHEDAEPAAAVAYHDLADLFGYRPSGDPHPYHCQRRGEHSRLTALEDFAAALDRFFDGEHPTRITCHRFQPVEAGLRPARTVYTGNFATTAEGLVHFIPFADLGLRMAGPVLGRLLQAQLGAAFAEAPLPLLHRRTETVLGRSEYRRGVARQAETVELAEEFERQFYGDLMLFGMEKLVARGYPEQVPDRATLQEVLEETAAMLEARYQARQRRLAGGLAALGRLLQDPACWWNQDPRAATAREALARFLQNMEHNFGPQAAAPARLADAGRRARWLERMVAALAEHPRLAEPWAEALAAG